MENFVIYLLMFLFGIISVSPFVFIIALLVKMFNMDFYGTKQGESKWNKKK